MHGRFHPNPPASQEAIQTLIKLVGRPLPSAYLDAMAIANGGVGSIGSRYVPLWKIEELIEKNKRHKVSQCARNLFLIGSNGGGEAYAFDLAKGDGAVYVVPFIGMDPQDAILFMQSFDAFVPRVNFLRKSVE